MALALTAVAACGGASGADANAPAQASLPAPSTASPGAAPSPSTSEAAAPANPADANAPLAVVYKSSTCGCCNNWVAHMRQSGFRVETHDVDPQAQLDAVKDQQHVPGNLRSCHTARVGNYVIEGHVPADLVQRLLREHPADIAGLAVPGMVTGSPGMEGPDPQHYDVVAFTKDGQTRVYASR
ncbi:MAG: DUF411 domain-containing protein [Gemmatimonadetes bacterium]|nr:DUF411 domain-containing protein [Gemmatimonadota bacterium]